MEVVRWWDVSRRRSQDTPWRRRQQWRGWKPQRQLRLTAAAKTHRSHRRAMRDRLPGLAVAFLAAATNFGIRAARILNKQAVVRSSDG